MPCPPRGTVPVNTGARFCESVSPQHARFAFGQGCDCPSYVEAFWRESEVLSNGSAVAPACFWNKETKGTEGTEGPYAGGGRGYARLQGGGRLRRPGRSRSPKQNQSGSPAELPGHEARLSAEEPLRCPGYPANLRATRQALWPPNP